MLLSDYIHEQIQKRRRPSIVFSTDLEPDDLISIYALISSLKQREADQSDIELSFLVGEGHSGIKALRMRKVIELLREQDLIDPSLHIRVIQGYGSNKDFSLDGLEIFSSKDEIQTTLDSEGLTDGLAEAQHQETKAQLCALFSENPESYILGIKPPREFIDLASDPALPELLRHTIYLGSFSFNIRTIISEVFDDAKKCGEDTELATNKIRAAIFRFLDSVKEMTYVEAFFTTGTKNSVSEVDSPELFQMMKETPLGNVLLSLLHNFNAHMLGLDPIKVAHFAVDPLSQERVKELMSQQWTQESENQINQLLSFNNISNEDEKKKEIDGVNRKLKKWKNITANGSSFITADVITILAALFGTEHTMLQALQFGLEYDASNYTKLTLPYSDETSSRIASASPSSVVGASTGSSMDAISSTQVNILIPFSNEQHIDQRTFISYLTALSDLMVIEGKISKSNKEGKSTDSLLLSKNRLTETLADLSFVKKAQSQVYQGILTLLPDILRPVFNLTNTAGESSMMNLSR